MIPNVTSYNTINKYPTSFRGNINKKIINPKLSIETQNTTSKVTDILKGVAKLPLCVLKYSILTLFGLGIVTVGIFDTLKELFEKEKDITDKENVPDLKTPKPPEIIESLAKETEGYPLISSNAEFATKAPFKFEKESTITFVDGTEQNLEDFVKENGLKMRPLRAPEYFIKDENGNIFRKTSTFDNGEYYLFQDKQTYYAVDENNDVYSIDLSKLPVGKEFLFCETPVTIKTLVPRGAIVKYGGEILKSEYGENNYQRLTCLPNRKPYLFPVSRIKEETLEKASQEKLDNIYEKLEKEEQLYIDKLKNEIESDNKQRNMSLKPSFSIYEMCTPAEIEEASECEKYFYKKAYDYYIDKYPEYKNCKFVFHRENSTYIMEIMNGEEIIKTIRGHFEVVDGPIFANTRDKSNIGEFKMECPLL